MSAALDLLRSRPGFRRLWIGTIVSQLGDWIGWVAVAMVGLSDGGGAWDLALIFAAHHLPAALLSPVAGVVADRLDRRTVLLATSLGLGVLTLGMAAAAAAESLWMLELLLFARSAAVAFYAPAERAALPRVVGKDELLLASTLDSTTWSVIYAFGMAAGGVLSLLGPTTALLIDAGTFALSTIVLFGLPKMRPEQRDERPPTVWRSLPDAVSYVWPRSGLRRAVFAKSPYALAAGAAWIALAIAADDLTGAAMGGVAFGALHALRGIGTGLGPMTLLAAVRRGRDRLSTWRILYWVGLLGCAGVGFANHVGWLLVASLLWGIGGGANWVASTELIQRCSEDGILARTNALDQIGMILAMTAGALVTALLYEAGLSLGWSAAIPVGLGSLGWLALDVSSRGQS